MNKTIVKLFILCLLFVSINQIVLNLDNKPLFFDAKNNNICSYNILNKAFEDKSIMCGSETFRPPLMRFLSFDFMLGFGMSEDTSLMFNYLFIFILIFGIYYLGELLFSKKVGFYSAIIISLLPAIFSFSRVFKEAFMMTALIVPNLYFILKTNYFENKKYSLLSGIILGLGMLVMPTYIVYIIGPVVFIFIKIFFLEEKKKKLTNFLIFVFSAIIVSGWWYFNNIIKTFKIFVNGSILNSNNAYSYYSLWYEPKSLLFYFLALFVIQLSIPTSLFLVLALKKYLKNPLRFISKNNSIIIGLFILVPIIFFTLVNAKSVRYTLPILSVLTIFICGIILDKKTNTKLIKYILISTLLLQFIIINLNLFGYGKFLDSFEYQLDPSFKYYSPDVKDSLYYPITNYTKDNITSTFKELDIKPYEHIIIIPFDYKIFGDFQDYSYKHNHRWVIETGNCNINQEISQDYVFFIQNTTAKKTKGILPNYCNQSQTKKILSTLNEEYQFINSETFVNKNILVFEKIT